jgi:hypothetical protein
VVDFLAAKGGEDNPPPTLLTGSRPGRLFSVPKSEGRAGWHDVDPGDLQEQLRGGHQVYRQGRLRRRLHALEGAVRKVHSCRRQLCPKITRNKLFAKLIHIEVILPGAFDSNHTSYVFAYCVTHP